MKKIIMIVAIVAIVAGAVVILPRLPWPESETGQEVATEEAEPEVITEEVLKRIINVSDLSTFEAVYNGVAEVMNAENPEEIDYYVSYDAKVKAGFDFEKLGIDLDNDNKKIVVHIPEIGITEVDVDIASLDYMFMNDEANTSTVSEQAYKKCIEDATEESESEKEIYELAEQNAKNLMQALLDPFVGQLDEEYRVEILVDGATAQSGQSDNGEQGNGNVQDSGSEQGNGNAQDSGNGQSNDSGQANESE